MAVLVLLVITAAISTLANKFLLGDLSQGWALAVTGLLVVTIGGSLLTRFVAWPLASRQAELFDTTQTSQNALSHDEHFRQQFAQLDRELAAAPSEPAAIKVLGDYLSELGISDLIELHVINAFDDTLDFVAANRSMVLPSSPASPWDCKAAVASATVTTETTSSPDACAHLRTRVSAPVSAVSVPLTAQGGILGVLHATGPEGDPPTPTAVIILESFAARAALNIALQRSSTEAWRPHIDTTTSLPTDDDVAIVVARALADNRPQAVGWLSIDNLTRLDAEHGSEVTRGYQRWLASLLLSLLPPGSSIGTRPDGDFLLAIDLPGGNTAENSSAAGFADAVERIELVRAAVAQRRGRDLPDVTVSAGVIGSTGAPSTIALLARARAGLDHARKSGGNIVVQQSGQASS